MASEKNSSHAISLMDEVIERIVLLLQMRVGHDFSGYKSSALSRCLSRRMNIHQIVESQQYLQFVQAHPHELDLLFQELLIGVTRFFRDRQAFECLAMSALPQLLARKFENDTIRLWVPGCATGEEAYTLAILFQEGFENAGERCNVRIFATDLDPQAIEIARRGVYRHRIVADVSGERLERFFSEENGGYRVNTSIRDMVIFTTHNLLTDPPFINLDMVSCRNVLIYMDASRQKHLLSIFHFALQPGGFLLLGSSEIPSGCAHLFVPVHKRWKLFIRQETANASSSSCQTVSSQVARLGADGQSLLSASNLNPFKPRHTSPQQLFTATYAPSSVIINNRGDIIHIHGNIDAYMQQASAQRSLNILDMVHKGCRIFLASGIRQALGQENKVILGPARIEAIGGAIFVRIAVQQITEPQHLQGLLRISFETLAAYARDSDAEQTQQSRGVALEIQLLQEELRHTREALASLERFQVTHEELQATSEALLSAQHELEARNDELQEVNAELKCKVECLTEVNDDMANLLNATGTMAIFLDHDLRIRHFTPQAQAVFHVVPSDIGRFLKDIASVFTQDDPAQEAEEVLRTLCGQDRELKTTSGIWYLMRTRPYRSARHVIKGVVITFSDITRLKHAETARQSAEVLARWYADNMGQSVREPWVMLDAELRVVLANQGFYDLFQLIPEKAERHYLYELGHWLWDPSELQRRLVDSLQRNEVFEGVELSCDVPRLGYRMMRLKRHRAQQQTGEDGGMLLTIEDITPA